MQLGVYIVWFVMNHQRHHKTTLVESILRQYFCCLYAVHGSDCTYAVCEDSIVRDTSTGAVRFHMFDRYARDPLQDTCRVVLENFGELQDAERFIAHISDGGAVPNALFF